MNSMFISKYRNAAIAPVKKQAWISTQSSPLTSSDAPLKSSSSALAYKAGPSGTQVCIWSLKNNSQQVISPGTVVVDLDYSPFSNNASTHSLAIGCEDGTIKIFDDALLKSTLKQANSDSKKMDNINFHSTTADIVASSTDKISQIWDIHQESHIRDMESPDQIQSMAWSFDGSKLSTVSKDNYLRQWDPRQKTQIAEGICHSGIKPSKVVDLKEEHFIFTTGFSQKREREYAVWDARNLKQAVKLQCIDSSVGMLSPLYDPDADLMFLLGKGDSVIRWMHVDSTRVIDFPSVSVGSSIMAGSLLPKRSCDVMAGEADRLYIATANGSTVIPVSVTVPRRTYADFHADLFPDTRSSVAAVSGAEWESGANVVPDLMSLNSAMNRPKEVAKSNGTPVPETLKSVQKQDSIPNIVKPFAQVNLANTDSPKASPKAIPKFGTKTSSYRFIDGKATALFTDLKDISLNNNNETNGFEVNEKYVAFALAGAGGRIGVWSVSKTGRLPVKIPLIICGSELCDFKWNPFCNDELVTATEDGRIRTWTIPEGGLSTDTEEPTKSFTAHMSRVSLVAFHPFASDILLSASPEQGSPTIKVWDTKNGKQVSVLNHPDHVLAAAFSADGTQIASVARDKTIRVFDARSGDLLHHGPAHDGVKAARVVWLGDTGRICSVGFAKANAREVKIYDASNVETVLGTALVGTSPSILAPFYDRDTGLIVLHGRGEAYVQFLELSDSAVPQTVNRYEGGAAQQSLQLLPKRFCDVKNVEIFIGYRLTMGVIEKLSFTVPRLHKDHFQDDIYTATLDVENPVLSAEEWVEGKTPQLKWIDLRPTDMPLLSQRSTQATQEKKVISFVREISEQERKDAAMKAMFDTAKQQDAKLEQDDVEGVDSDEWDD